MFHVKDREMVIPGQMIGVDVKYGMNSYSEKSNVYSLVKGLARIDGESVTVIPSRGGYTPKEDDTVLGIVTDSNSAGWVVDINTAYRCFLRKDEVNPRPERPGGRHHRGPRRREERDESPPRQQESFNVGDIVSAKMLSVDEVYDGTLTRPWKLAGGLIVSMNPKRIPRLIGKKQAMLNMIKEKTACKIVTGQNGLVWIKGDNVTLVVEAIRTIEREAETQGLTNRIGVMLDEKVKSHSRVDENEEPGN